MIIFGFDCAIENLGICILHFNENWNVDVEMIVKKINNMCCILEACASEGYTSEGYTSEGYTSESSTPGVLSKIKCLINEINIFINNIIKVNFINVVDLIPGKNAKDFSIVEKTTKLKYLLTALDDQSEKPDVVLIEYQMKANDISRILSAQIAYHYAALESDIMINNKNTKNRKDSALNQCSINYAVKEFPIEFNKNKLIELVETPITSASVNPKLPCKRIVELVGASLKNIYKIAPDGDYGNFISKYSAYTANKKHTTYNMLYFMDNFTNNDNIKNIFKNIPNKINDMADAFMMCFGWLIKNNKIC